MKNIDTRHTTYTKHNNTNNTSASWNVMECHGMSDRCRTDVGQMSWLLLQQLPDVAQNSNFQLLSLCQKTLRYVRDGHQHARHVAHIETKTWRLYATIPHYHLNSSSVILSCTLTCLEGGNTKQDEHHLENKGSKLKTSSTDIIVSYSFNMFYVRVVQLKTVWHGRRPTYRFRGPRQG